MLRISLPVLTLWLCLFAVPAALATRLPGDLKKGIVKEFPDAEIRLDGSFQTKKSELYLPLMPGSGSKKKFFETTQVKTFPSEEEKNVLSFDDGWFYLKVIKRGRFSTIIIPSALPADLKKALLASKFVPDLIVPENFVLPGSLKSTIGDLSIICIEDTRIASPNFGEPTTQKHHNSSHGMIFVSSPSTGKISLLEEGTLKKIAEFPTEGTPGGMAYAGGKLYIADQSKNRVLKLDPAHKQFIGQIDLPSHSAPKGVATLPDGELLYVSENGSNNVAVFEVKNDRLLVRTKVLSGPTHIAVTPNGNSVLVLDVTVGKLTIMATQSQKVLGTVPVGTLPNAIVISPDSQHAYVSNRLSNTVSIIDIPKLKNVSSLATGTGPTGMTLDASGERLFVANAKDNTITVFDLKTNQKIEEIKLPVDIDFPSGLILLPNKVDILVSSAATEAIGVLNADTLKFERQPNIGHTSDNFLWVPSEAE